MHWAARVCPGSGHGANGWIGRADRMRVKAVMDAVVVVVNAGRFTLNLAELP